MGGVPSGSVVPPAASPSDAEPFAADGGPVGVVLSHGFTGEPASLRPWAQHLADAGFTVRLPLLPGHGGTWQDTNRTRWPDWYGAVEAAYDEVAARCTTVFAGGLSMGGTLVTRLAEVKGDAIAGLVLVNPSYATQRWDAKLAPYLTWALKSTKSIGGDIKKPGVAEPANDRTPVVAFASLMKFWQVTRADLARVTAPIRLYRSVEDHVVEPLSGAAAARRRYVHDRGRGPAARQLPRRHARQRRAEDLRRQHRVHPLPRPRDSMTSAAEPDRRDNGLVATSYVPLTDVAAPLAAQLLNALGRARIPAYLAEAPGEDPGSDNVRLFVASGERGDARTIVASVVRATGDAAPLRDPLDGMDSEAEFARLVAGWHVDTHTAIRDAERQLTSEDEDWRARLAPPQAEEVADEEEHYVPPPPPPLPRLAAPTLLGVLLIALSVGLLAFGTRLGFDGQFSLLFGVLGVLLGTAVLIMRLREHHDDEDDGAVL